MVVLVLLLVVVVVDVRWKLWWMDVWFPAKRARHIGIATRFIF